MKVKLRWSLPGLIIITLLFTICLLHRSTHKAMFRVSSSNSNINTDSNTDAVGRALVSNTIENLTTSSTVASAFIDSKNNYNINSSRDKLMNIMKKSTQLLTPYVTSVTSDVHGNLGDPIVVLSENVENWLTDRWQAASNMQGSPIPGEHYLHLFFNHNVIIKHVIIDFETAFSDHYRLLGCVTNNCDIELATSSSRKVIDTSKNHIIHLIGVSIESPVTGVKLVIDKPSSRWGTSIWRLQLHGHLLVA